jgi:hypothetical protein
MPRPALATLAWINPDCHDGGRPGQGKLARRKVYGKDHIRLLRCGGCHAAFSERRHPALVNTNVSEATAEEIMDHLDAGCRVRAPSRLTKGAKATGARLLTTRGRQAQRFHAPEVRDLKPRALQCDEQWSVVQKKPKHCRPEDPHHAGDLWAHTAMAPESKVSGSLVVGKRPQGPTQALVSEAPSRLRKGHWPALCSDGSEGYEPAILAAFGRRSPAANTGLQGRPRLDSRRWPHG